MKISIPKGEQVAMGFDKDPVAALLVVHRY